MRRKFLFPLIALVMLSACRGDSADSAAPLPTAPPATSPVSDLVAAEKVARAFLDAWLAGDFATMHGLLTFRNRELTPFDAFQAYYESAQNRMWLEELEYRPHTLSGEGGVLKFHYDMTFYTRVLGDFTDADRLLHLVLDPQVGGWRVAWSEADIFAELGQGASLLFEAQVPGRANIYDRKGQALADQNGRVVRVLVNNERIPDREACYQVLSETLDRALADVVELFELRSGADWLVEAGILEPDAFIKSNDRIKLDCGADFRQKATRRYSEGALMPHVLGHVGYPDADQIAQLNAIGFNAETIIGKAGIEASMNDTLAGRPGGRLSLVGSDGRRVRVLGDVPSQVPESLWLTIDADLQAEIMRLLESAYQREDWGEESDGASVVIMDVNNGEILALVSYPSYDANIINPFPTMGRAEARQALEELAKDERRPQLNRATQGAYPTGSVMKGLSALAALESGVYDETTRYTCIGVWNYGGDVRYDWLAGGHGVMSVQSGVTNSCNPFFYEVGFRLNAVDPGLLSSWALKMGLGQATGINTLPEEAGNIPTPGNVERTTGLPWSYAHAVNLSIGQGEVQASPLQMLRMYAAIANGGYLLRPHLVRERGILDQRTPMSERDVMLDAELDPANLAIIRRGMCDVVNTYSGTAAHQFYGSPLLEIGVCGKTGTAQVPEPGKPPHSWFIAFAPAKEPQIAIVTMVENVGDGSAVAAPLTRDILEYFFFGADGISR